MSLACLQNIMANTKQGLLISSMVKGFDIFDDFQSRRHMISCMEVRDRRSKIRGGRRCQSTTRIQTSASNKSTDRHQPRLG